MSLIEYDHPEVLSDFREALCAMYAQHGDGSNRHLRAEPANARRVFVFSKKNGRPMRSEFPIANKVFQALMRSTWTQPTYANNIFDRTRLVLSPSGAQAYRDRFHEELVIDALANLSAANGGMKVMLHLVGGVYWFVAEKPTGDMRGRSAMPQIVEAMLKRGLIEPAPPRLDDDGEPQRLPPRFQISSFGSSYIGSVRQ